MTQSVPGYLSNRQWYPGTREFAGPNQIFGEYSVLPLPLTTIGEMGHTREYPAFVERGTQPGISGLFSVYDTQTSRTRTRTYSYHTRRV